jgi:uncharacterized protein YjbJ (UPF0337 family)
MSGPEVDRRDTPGSGTSLALLCRAATADVVAPHTFPEGSMEDDRTTTEKGVDNNIRGKGKELKGRVKDAVGGLTDDSSLQAEGKIDKVKGKIQSKVGDAQRKIGRKEERP